MRNTEKTFGRVVTVVAFIFLAFVVYKCEAQVVREVFLQDGENVVKRYVDYALELKTPLTSGEDILLSAMSDSIDTKTITFALFAYFPKGINPKGADIVITYKDGTTDVFKQTRFEKETNYVEYQAVIGINNIFIKPMKSMLIRGIAKYDNVEKNYFTEFFANL